MTAFSDWIISSGKFQVSFHAFVFLAMSPNLKLMRSPTWAILLTYERHSSLQEF